MKGQTQQQSRRDADSKPQMAIPNATRRIWDLAICASPPTPSIAFQAPPGDPSPKRSLVLLPGALEDLRRVGPPSKDFMSDHPTTALMQHPHLFEEFLGVPIHLDLIFQKAALFRRQFAVEQLAHQYL
jgi:hypothetical protein